MYAQMDDGTCFHRKILQVAKISESVELENKYQIIILKFDCFFFAVKPKTPKVFENINTSIKFSRFY
jgi:hypothetical protein